MKNPTQKILVSIVVPSFNQGRFVDQTIQSILAQNYRPIEIIIIDACSTDETISILRRYANIPEVKWVSEADNGHADGVNKGFLLTKGDIVAWLNSDDAYYSRDTIDTVVRFFQKNAGVDVLYGDVAAISANNTLLRLILLPSYNKGRILRKNLIFQPAVFMRKYVTENEKLDINQIGLDYEYWLRLIAKGFRFYHLNRILACDRHYPERTSVTKKTLINTQIAIAKTKMGLSRTQSKLMLFIDRSFQAVCRIKGLAFLLTAPLFQDKRDAAVPIKIDSYPKLLWRQLTKAIGSDFKIY